MNTIKTTVVLSSCALLLAAAAVRAVQGDEPSPGKPIVGEVRAIAVSPASTERIATLHRDGWLEAKGQLLSTRDYADLFAAVGRQWTTRETATDRFAIPRIPSLIDRDPTGDPFGALGPGDGPTSGPVADPWLQGHAITYWMYTGRDLGQGGAVAPSAR